MKIAITGDNHVFSAWDTQKQVKAMMKEIKEQNPDVVINLGDMGELLLVKQSPKALTPLLHTIPTTLYVLGNHDLYANPKRPPDHAMSDYLNLLKYGIPLQKSWYDNDTIFIKDDCVFCGVIGWPDFISPRLPFPPEYYERHYPTIDAEHIDLSLGWSQYGKTQYDAFEQRLIKAAATQLNNVIVITHYSIFESQYYLGKEDISAYFFCHTIGQIVKRVASQYNNKYFFCFSAHGHEFNSGRWGTEGLNIATFGLTTTYYKQDYIMFDSVEFFNHGG